MRVLIIIIVSISLLSCAPRRPAKVVEVNGKPHRSQTKSNSRHPVRKNQNTTHKVVKGDSLYSIGFRYQKDYKTLAAINNITPPYRIYPNQIIKLAGNSNKPSQKVVFKPQKKHSSSTTNTAKGVQTKPMVNNEPVTAKNDPIKPINKPNNKPALNPIKPTTQQTTHAPAKQVQNTNQPPVKKLVVVATPTKTNLKWVWPTQGKIRTTFLASNPARKGISIGGAEGQPVKATEAGVVVYSGNGLLGYGELIIIKHNDQYLSAYGHNKALKVKEGQSVTRGQVIAELGSSGTNVNNLHFEIRKNGKPVNPLNYVKP